MKNQKLILIILTIFLYSCHMKNCVDNISKENKKVKYHNKDLIAFVNDTLGTKYDTITLELRNVEGETYNEDDYKKDGEQCFCWTYSDIIYSNHFYLDIYQGCAHRGNPIIYTVGYLSIDSKKKLEEQTNYYIKADTIKANHIIWSFDISDSITVYTYPKNSKKLSPLWIRNNNPDSNYYYNDFYYTNDKEIKLLQYSTFYKDGSHRVWRLKQ